MRLRRIQFGILVLLLLSGAGLVLGRQNFVDWLKLRDYNPPAIVSTLADQTTMTTETRHLFYVNHPAVTSDTTFAKACPVAEAKTVVLGCYIGNDNGIFIYKMSDVRLDGVEQVTAAHEALHAAYSRLSSTERKRVDGLLLAYYNTGLTDQRIKDTIDAYKKSEPNDVVNEMHSIFGTEVAQLPPELEQYYARYFSNRATITAYTAKYQGEFTSRRQKIDAYDAQLSDLRKQIDQMQNTANSQRSDLQTQNARLEAERASGRNAEYNAGVSGYNAAVASYNTLITTIKQQINDYNGIVAARNAIALEEQTLTKAFSGSAVKEQ